jgi:hypothetical protein
LSRVVARQKCLMVVKNSLPVPFNLESCHLTSSDVVRQD